MSATLLGTTGNWGIPDDEAGLIITDISFEFSQKDKPVLTKQGDVQGLSLYQQKMDLKYSGLVSKTAPFATKLGAVLTIVNDKPDHLSTTTGSVILMGVIRKLNQEDFEMVDVISVLHQGLIAA